MAPTRSSGRRTRSKRKAQNVHRQEPVVVSDDDEQLPDVEQLFLDPMSGQPLQLYIEKDVEHRDVIAESVIKYGGAVSPGYSGVLYVLVDPYQESGQNLYRQYAGKKNKIVLNATWVARCIQDKTLHGFATNWAGCKVTGKELSAPSGSALPAPLPPPPAQQQPGPFTTAPHPSVYHTSVHNTHIHHPSMHAVPVQPPPLQPGNVQSAPIPAVVQPAGVAPAQTVHGHPMPITASAHDPLSSNPPPPSQSHQPGHQPEYAYPPPMHAEASAPPQTWQASNGIAPQQTHIAPPPPYRGPHDYREWAYPPPAPPQHQHPPPTHPHTQQPPSHHGPPVVEYASHPAPPHSHQEYDYRYREHNQSWVDNAAEYYAQQYGPPAPYAYHPEPPPQMPEAGPSTIAPEIESSPPRGRKRSRTQQPGAPPASTLVANRKNPVTRSPTPPTRVIKSTYGGNLFTVDDVMYLKKYIDYCQEQGLVLSLREICERIAIKAPHHTFYSWRRYCNKHQIRLGGYAMEIDHDDLGEGSGHPIQEEGEELESAAASQPQPPISGVIPGSIATAKRAAQADTERARSPTPPKALYRSTTGKGVAFTEEDVTFLIRFLEYRARTQEGKLDMVAFWKDVAIKAPHHSRASWMKFYRRHKHELHHEDGDEPLPQAPEKKMRYSKADDVLLAKYFFHKREGTSDKVFQEFGRQHPHHPWKGWQEHHRIHKAKIEHLISKMQVGESIEEEGEE